MTHDTLFVPDDAQLDAKLDTKLDAKVDVKVDGKVDANAKVDGKISVDSMILPKGQTGYLTLK
eukprot:604001-Amorphochlora_amoeboformis.AAC.1